MGQHLNTVIIGSGCYIPSRKIPNSYFLDHEFFDANGTKLKKPTEEIIKKFYEITGIQERRYVTDDLNTSDIAYFAAKEAITSSGVDPETIELIIVAHNFGDISADNLRSEFVPSLATRVKQKLNIQNPHAVGYDLIFGCAGLNQAMIQANALIKTGSVKKALVIGAETLSRITDPHDRDSMLYADGAGALILEAQTSRDPVGLIAECVETNAGELSYVLRMDKSYNPAYKGNELFLKMQGRTLYEHALKIVPGVIKKSLDKTGLSLADVDKLLIHQANDKMIKAILKRVFEQYSVDEIPDVIMPTTISWLGNSSVATIPTLYDLMNKGKLKGHELKKGSTIILASVGAGVNINSIVYKLPL